MAKNVAFKLSDEEHEAWKEYAKSQGRSLVGQAQFFFRDTLKRIGFVVSSPVAKTQEREQVQEQEILEEL